VTVQLPSIAARPFGASGKPDMSFGSPPHAIIEKTDIETRSVFIIFFLLRPSSLSLFACLLLQGDGHGNP
jgi:hypothetical protein